MRRAIPNPCSGPRACSVFKIIRSSVPCSTSDFLVSIFLSVSSLLAPRIVFASGCFAGLPAAVPSYGLPKGAYRLSFAMSIGRRRAAVVFSLGYHSLLEPRIKTPVSNEHSGKTKTFNTQGRYLISRAGQMAHSTELFERSALNDTPSRIELTKCMLVFL